jgi:hypothetical protein
MNDTEARFLTGWQQQHMSGAWLHPLTSSSAVPGAPAFSIQGVPLEWATPPGQFTIMICSGKIYISSVSIDISIIIGNLMTEPSLSSHKHSLRILIYSFCSSTLLSFMSLHLLQLGIHFPSAYLFSVLILNDLSGVPWVSMHNTYLYFCVFNLNIQGIQLRCYLW